MAVARIPKELVEEIKKLGYDVDSFVIEAIREKVSRHLRKQKQ